MGLVPFLLLASVSFAYDSDSPRAKLDPSQQSAADPIIPLPLRAAACRRSYHILRRRDTKIGWSPNTRIVTFYRENDRQLY